MYEMGCCRKVKLNNKHIMKALSWELFGCGAGGSVAEQPVISRRVADVGWGARHWSSQPDSQPVESEP